MFSSEQLNFSKAQMLHQLSQGAEVPEVRLLPNLHPPFEEASALLDN